MTRRRACLVIFAASSLQRTWCTAGDRKYGLCIIIAKNDNDFYHLVDDSTRRKRLKTCHKVEELATSDTGRQLSDSYFPINQLPGDVLAEIFIQCLPEVILWPEIEGKSTEDVAPLLLCDGRALAISIPHLWKQLFLPLRPKSNREEAITMTHTWIRRSGELPLTLAVYTMGSCSGDFYNPLLNALINYASRWEHVNFNYFISLPQVGHMPCLRSFNMTTRGKFPFAPCPKLSRIS